MPFCSRLSHVGELSMVVYGSVSGTRQPKALRQEANIMVANWIHKMTGAQWPMALARVMF